MPTIETTQGDVTVSTLFPNFSSVDVATLIEDARRRQEQYLANITGRVVRATVRGIASHLFLPVLRWHVRSRLHAELMSMDEHLLADIGLRRDQVSSIADACTDVLRMNPAPKATIHPFASQATQKTGTVTATSETTTLAA